MSGDLTHSVNGQPTPSTAAVVGGIEYVGGVAGVSVLGAGVEDFGGAVVEDFGGAVVEDFGGAVEAGFVVLVGDTVVLVGEGAPVVPGEGAELGAVVSPPDPGRVADGDPVDPALPAEGDWLGLDPVEGPPVLEAGPADTTSTATCEEREPAWAVIVDAPGARPTTVPSLTCATDGLSEVQDSPFSAASGAGNPLPITPDTTTASLCPA
jgi:hypothetical protein